MTKTQLLNALRKEILTDLIIDGIDISSNNESINESINICINHLTDMIKLSNITGVICILDSKEKGTYYNNYIFDVTYSFKNERTLTGHLVMLVSNAR